MRFFTIASIFFMLSAVSTAAPIARNSEAIPAAFEKCGVDAANGATPCAHSLRPRSEDADDSFGGSPYRRGEPAPRTPKLRSKDADLALTGSSYRRGDDALQTPEIRSEDIDNAFTLTGYKRENAASHIPELRSEDIDNAYTGSPYKRSKPESAAQTPELRSEDVDNAFLLTYGRDNGASRSVDGIDAFGNSASYKRDNTLIVA